jgi:predicted enzyme related to lactoylglutathione lyase
MPVSARFTHVNIVAKDWNKLASFYEEVFGCTPMPPERDISGKWLEDATGVPGAHIRGIHLRLPGHGPEGPTLELFQYGRAEARPETATNRPGFAHIAFAVDDVPAALEAVKRAGGGAAGKTVSLDVPGAGTVTIVYATDPEGNLVELQKWPEQTPRTAG